MTMTTTIKTMTTTMETMAMTIKTMTTTLETMAMTIKTLTTTTILAVVCTETAPQSSSAPWGNGPKSPEF